MTKCLYYHVPVTVSSAQGSVQIQVYLVSLEVGLTISIRQAKKATESPKLQSYRF